MFEILDYYIDMCLDCYDNLLFIETHAEFILRCVDKANNRFEAELWEL